MGSLVTQFVICAIIIMIAGAFLARFADQLGHITKLGRSMAGMILLAIATSLPELVVGRKAVQLDIPNPDLTVGDLLGSSLMNLLILAIIDLISKSRGRMLSRAAAAHALTAITSILLTGIAVLFIYLKVDFALEGMGLTLGLGSISIVVGYIFCLRLIYFDQQFALANAPEEVQDQKVSVPLAVVGYLLAAGVIFYVAPTLAHVADKLAIKTGLSGSFIGTTMVALVTSLPEAVTTFTAMRMGAVDMAIGNVLGSNAFNMLIMLGVDLSYSENLLSEVSSVHILTGLSVMIVTSVAILGMLYRAEKKLWLFEPDAVLMILLIFGSLTMVYYQS